MNYELRITSYESRVASIKRMCRRSLNYCLVLLVFFIIAGGIFAEVFVRGQMIVYGDAAATARNIIENEFLYRLGFAVHLFYHACAVTTAGCRQLKRIRSRTIRGAGIFTSAISLTYFGFFCLFIGLKL